MEPPHTWERSSYGPGRVRLDVSVSCSALSPVLFGLPLILSLLAAVLSGTPSLAPLHVVGAKPPHPSHSPCSLLVREGRDHTIGLSFKQLDRSSLEYKASPFNFSRSKGPVPLALLSRNKLQDSLGVSPASSSKSPLEPAETPSTSSRLSASSSSSLVSGFPASHPLSSRTARGVGPAPKTAPPHCRQHIPEPRPVSSGRRPLVAALLGGFAKGQREKKEGEDDDVRSGETARERKEDNGRESAASNESSRDPDGLGRMEAFDLPPQRGSSGDEGWGVRAAGAGSTETDRKTGNKKEPYPGVNPFLPSLHYTLVGFEVRGSRVLPPSVVRTAEKKVLSLLARNADPRGRDEPKEKKRQVLRSEEENAALIRAFIALIHEWYALNGYVFARLKLPPQFVRKATPKNSASSAGATSTDSEHDFIVSFTCEEPLNADPPLRITFFRRSTKEELTSSQSKEEAEHPRVAQASTASPATTGEETYAARPPEVTTETEGGDQSSSRGAAEEHEDERGRRSRHRHLWKRTEGNLRPQALAKHLDLEAGKPFKWNEIKWRKVAGGSDLFEEAQATAHVLPGGKGIQVEVTAVEKPIRRCRPGFSVSAASLREVEGQLRMEHRNLDGCGARGRVSVSLSPHIDPTGSISRPRLSSLTGDLFFNSLSFAAVWRLPNTTGKSRGAGMLLGGAPTRRSEESFRVSAYAASEFTPPPMVSPVQSLLLVRNTRAFSDAVLPPSPQHTEQNCPGPTSYVTCTDGAGDSVSPGNATEQPHGEAEPTGGQPFFKWFQNSGKGRCRREYEVPPPKLLHAGHVRVGLSSSVEKAVGRGARVWGLANLERRKGVYVHLKEPTAHAEAEVHPVGEKGKNDSAGGVNEPAAEHLSGDEGTHSKDGMGEKDNGKREDSTEIVGVTGCSIPSLVKESRLFGGSSPANASSVVLAAEEVHEALQPDSSAARRRDSSIWSSSLPSASSSSASTPFLSDPTVAHDIVKLEGGARLSFRKPRRAAEDSNSFLTSNGRSFGKAHQDTTFLLAASARAGVYVPYAASDAAVAFSPHSFLHTPPSPDSGCAAANVAEPKRGRSFLVTLFRKITRQKADAGEHDDSSQDHPGGAETPRTEATAGSGDEQSWFSVCPFVSSASGAPVNKLRTRVLCGEALHACRAAGDRLAKVISRCCTSSVSRMKEAVEAARARALAVLPFGPYFLSPSSPSLPLLRSTPPLPFCGFSLSFASRSFPFASLSASSCPASPAVYSPPRSSPSPAAVNCFPALSRRLFSCFDLSHASLHARATCDFLLPPRLLLPILAAVVPSRRSGRLPSPSTDVPAFSTRPTKGLEAILAFFKTTPSRVRRSLREYISEASAAVGVAEALYRDAVAGMLAPVLSSCCPSSSSSGELIGTPHAQHAAPLASREGHSSKKNIREARHVQGVSTGLQNANYASTSSAPAEGLETESRPDSSSASSTPEASLSFSKSNNEKPDGEACLAALCPRWIQQGSTRFPPWELLKPCSALGGNRGRPSGGLRGYVADALGLYEAVLGGGVELRIPIVVRQTLFPGAPPIPIRLAEVSIFADHTVGFSPVVISSSSSSCEHATSSFSGVTALAAPSPASDKEQTPVSEGSAIVDTISRISESGESTPSFSSDRTGRHVLPAFERMRERVSSSTTGLKRSIQNFVERTQAFTGWGARRFPAVGVTVRLKPLTLTYAKPIRLESGRLRTLPGRFHVGFMEDTDEF